MHVERHLPSHGVVGRREGLFPKPGCGGDSKRHVRTCIVVVVTDLHYMHTCKQWCQQYLGNEKTREHEQPRET